MNSERLFTRNFTFLILGQISSLLGNYTLKFALSMYILEQTGSASVFAAMLAVAMLPTILLSPFGGILADRANRRWIMVGLDSLSGLTVLTAGLLLPFGSDLLVIGALLVILSVLAAFESPTVQACIPQILSEDNLMRGNAAVNQAQAITSLVTPFLGSIIYAAFGLMPILWGAVACFFLTAFLECFIHLEFQKQEGSADLITIIKEDFSASVHFLRWEQPAILKLLLLAAMASLFVAGTVVVGFPYLVRGVAAVLGSLFVGITAQKFRLRWLAFVFMGLGLSIIPTGMAFLLPVGPLGIYIILLVMFSLGQFGCSLFSTYAISVIQTRTPEHLMGKVMSYVFTLAMCAQPIGQIIYGSLFDWFSNTPYFVLIPSGVLVCVIGLLSKTFFKKFETS